MPDGLLNVNEAAAYLTIKPWTVRHWLSDRKIDFVKYAMASYASGEAYLTVIWEAVRSKRKSAMQTAARRNRDFSKGPVWDEAGNRWLVEIRYPDGARLRKRLRREREALRLWAVEQTKIENGSWDERAARNITVA